MDIISFINRRIGEGNYNKFIEWGFTEDPGPHPTYVVPDLWKHQSKFKVEGADYLADSLNGMIDLYLIENITDNDINI